MEGEKEVTREDQEMINQFGRLNAQLHEADDVVKVLSSELSAVQDAQSDVLLADEGSMIKLLVGESFFEVNPDAATEILRAREESLQSRIDASAAKATEIRAQLTRLKATLYGKFGRGAINLDED